MSVTAALVHHSPNYSYASSVLKTPGNQQVPASPGLHSPLNHGSITFQLFSGSHVREDSPVARVPDTGTSLLRQVLGGQKRHSASSPYQNAKRSCGLLNVPTVNSKTPLTPTSSEQIVPGSAEPKRKENGKNCQRTLPTTSKEGTKILDLFTDNEIFATREE